MIASVDAYRRFAEAVNRLDLEPGGQARGVPGLLEEVVGEVVENVAEHKTRRALQDVTGAVQKIVSSVDSREG